MREAVYTLGQAKYNVYNVQYRMHEAVYRKSTKYTNVQCNKECTRQCIV